MNEDGADDSSLLEGEPSFFMEVQKKHLNSCLFETQATHQPLLSDSLG